MTIGEAAKEARLRKGFSIQELSEKSGVTLNSIYRLENDKNTPLLSTVELLADALGLSIDEYVGHRVGGKDESISSL